MKRLLLSASLAVLALSSASAFADFGNGNDNGNGNGKQQKHQKQGKQAEYRDDRGDYRRDDRYDDRRDGHRDNGRHLGWQKQSFRRGERVPVGYLQPAYHVQDYRAYRLAPPPQGYRWVRPADGRYLLVQTTTGLISQILGY